MVKAEESGLGYKPEVLKFFILGCLADKVLRTAEDIADMCFKVLGPLDGIHTDLAHYKTMRMISKELELLIEKGFVDVELASLSKETDYRFYVYVIKTEV